MIFDSNKQKESNCIYGQTCGMASKSPPALRIQICSRFRPPSKPEIHWASLPWNGLALGNVAPPSRYQRSWRNASLSSRDISPPGLLSSSSSSPSLPYLNIPGSWNIFGHNHKRGQHNLPHRRPLEGPRGLAHPSCQSSFSHKASLALFRTTFWSEPGC